MSTIPKLTRKVALARENFIASASGLSHDQAFFKPSSDVWCVAEIAEHMVWAEHSGISGMWKAIDGIKNNKPIWSGDVIHQGLHVEDIVERTWKEKEQVPD